jgi:hypothetical protein
MATHSMVSKSWICPAVLLAATIPGFSQDGAGATGLPAYLWTAEERLEKRFDPVDIAERRDAYAKKHAANPGYHYEPYDPATGQYEIDGSRNPELFLPFELFDNILERFSSRILDETERARQQAFYDSLAKKGGAPPDFWEHLESVSRSYLTMKDAWRRRASTSRDDSTERCRARYDALQDARKVFGADWFDRFLYEVVAPEAQIAGAGDNRDLASRLLREHRGCP